MHSTPFSEVAAHVCGFVAGIAAYAVSSAVTHDHKLRIEIGMAASAIVNALIGGKINLIMHDFLALVLIRPLSAYLGAQLVEYVTTSMS